MKRSRAFAIALSVICLLSAPIVFADKDADKDKDKEPERDEPALKRAAVPRVRAPGATVGKARVREATT